MNSYSEKSYSKKQCFIHKAIEPICPASWVRPSLKLLALMSHLIKTWLNNYWTMLWLVAGTQSPFVNSDVDYFILFFEIRYSYFMSPFPFFHPSLYMPPQLLSWIYSLYFFVIVHKCVCIPKYMNAPCSFHIMLLVWIRFQGWPLQASASINLSK